jgi:hypothetical protein
MRLADDGYRAIEVGRLFDECLRQLTRPNGSGRINLEFEIIAEG